MMNKFIEQIKFNYFSLEVICEIISNITAIFLIVAIYYVLIEANLIQSDFLLFIILMTIIFTYYLLARTFFSFPFSLKDKFIIEDKVSTKLGEDLITKGITKAKLDVERGVYEPPSWEHDREAHVAYKEAHKELSKRKTKRMVNNPFFFYIRL